jgi:lipase chaperone LimK
VKHRRTPAAIAAAGALGLAAALALWGAADEARESELPVPRTDAEREQSARDPQHRAQVDPAGAALEPPLARSLRDTDVDGALVVDAAGSFVPTPDALALFDYFLAASGEEPLDVIRARIEAEIRRRLDGDAALAAEALLARYLDYREALRSLADGGFAPTDLAGRWQWIRELRREHFGVDTAEALFGDEEQVVRVDLERRRIAFEAELGDEARRDALESLEEQLPENVRSARRAAAAPARSQREVAALRDAGASEADIFAARERDFGYAAAERLVALDAERKAWRGRVADYRAERDGLLTAAAGDSQQELASALETLRREHFSGPELTRIRALDRAHHSGL